MMKTMNKNHIDYILVLFLLIGCDTKEEINKETIDYLIKENATLYGLPTCPHCIKIKKILYELNYVDCTKEKALCNELKILNVPVLIVNNKRYIGELEIMNVESSIGTCKDGKCIVRDMII